jgi:hypothetical protein
MGRLIKLRRSVVKEAAPPPTPRSKPDRQVPGYLIEAERVRGPSDTNLYCTTLHFISLYHLFTETYPHITHNTLEPLFTLYATYL